MLVPHSDLAENNHQPMDGLVLVFLLISVLVQFNTILDFFLSLYLSVLLIQLNWLIIMGSCLRVVWLPRECWKVSENRLLVC